jgi:Spy/CpxP family protein refolding chaperone
MRLFQRIPTIALVLACSFSVLAQQGGAPRGGGPPGGGGQPGGAPQPGAANNPGQPGGYSGPGGAQPPGGPPPGSAPDERSTVSTMHGGLQVGPPGRWWDDRHFAKELRLRSDQQKHMDAIFDQNRASLLKCFDALQDEESKMEALVRAPVLDEATLFAQIDRVALARAALEKANTHYLLQIRAEMTPDQIARLDQHR